MASRRDELNAYTYARKRTIAAFLQPSHTGSEEGAPRPVRTVLPSLVVGAVLLAGFGAWGMFKPAAPKGWDDVGAHVIVGSNSTTRYVVLKTGHKKQLHPVLNYASAKLLLKPDKSSVVKVKESELDSGDIPRGPTLGIPYAPDRMPDADEARAHKRWAVCEQPGGNGKTTQKAVFVLADRDAPKIEGDQRLRGDQALYVRDPQGARYLVDPRGTKYLIGGPDWRQLATGPDYNLLLRSLFRDGAKPQRVTKDWLATLNDGKPIVFPKIPGEIGAAAGVKSLDAKGANKVGMVLEAPTGDSTQHYIVLPHTVERVSPFVARLLLNSRHLAGLNQEGSPERVNASDFTPNETEFYGTKQWPANVPEQANSLSTADGGTASGTVCSVLQKVNKDGSTQLTTWAGKDYPATIPEGATSAYVTPGSGLLYRQVTGNQTKSGAIFLVTDTGLRYAVQANNDSGTDKPTEDGVDTGDSSSSNSSKDASQQTANVAQVRLGYDGVAPSPVPAKWSEFLPTGPRLDTKSAKQPQGS